MQLLVKADRTNANTNLNYLNIACLMKACVIGLLIWPLLRDGEELRVRRGASRRTVPHPVDSIIQCVSIGDRSRLLTLRWWLFHHRLYPKRPWCTRPIESRLCNTFSSLHSYSSIVYPFIYFYWSDRVGRRRTDSSALTRDWSILYRIVEPTYSLPM